MRRFIHQDRRRSAVSAVASILRIPEPEASPATRFTRVGRIAAVGTLVLGAAFQLGSFVSEPQTDRTIDRLNWIADHPDRADLTKVFDLLAMPFLIGTVLVYVLLARRRSPRLAYTGGILLGSGTIGLSAMMGFETLEFMLAQDGRFELTALADAVDQFSTPPPLVMLLLFLPGAFLGLLTMTVALWRSRAVPLGAVLLLPAFIVVDFVLQMGLLAHALSLLAACWIAWAVLRAGPMNTS